MKINYIVIPILTIATSLIGGFFTNSGMSWYRTISLPEFTPDGSVIGIVWTIIFILATISAIIVWNKTDGLIRKKIAWLFVVNAILNILWSVLFFALHLIGFAVIEAGLLFISVVTLIYFIRPISMISAIALYFYAIWVLFATFLTYNVWILN